MSSIGTGYDLSASTFSPDGRIFQVEYAMKAIDSSGTAIALRGKNCVVMAVEKIITSKLYERTSNCRITNVDRHIGFASAGVYPDASALAKYCEETAMDYRIEYGTPCPLEHLADTLANYMHAYTLYSAVRPFGAAVLLSSWSKVDGSQLYMVDPAGLGYAYHGCAMGKAKQAAKTEIEKLKLLEMTPEELLKQAARIIYATRDETKDKNFELELSWVGANTDGKHLLVPAEVSGPIVSEARRLVEDVDDDEEMAAEPTA